MSVMSRSEFGGERVLAAHESENQNLKSASVVMFSPSEAREVWPQVLEHKWYLSERAGRDVGLKAAALDYFKNVRRVTKKEQMREMSLPTAPCMRPLGYR